jgi:PTH1 family peptidyl-tRNA hydrolase
LKVILALGNPGERYRDTRHNAGWWLADHLAVRWSFPPFRPSGPEASSDGRVRGTAVRVVRPLTYMNRSGRALERYAQLPDFRAVADLLVLVDDAALPPGSFRLRARGSAGGHNGLASVESVLGSSEYGRLRIGVGAPPHPEVDLAAWVLAAPSPAEEEAVLETFERSAQAIECWVAEGIEPAMNAFNRS